jgi:hypothetical protein
MLPILPTFVPLHATRSSFLLKLWAALFFLNDRCLLHKFAIVLPFQLSQDL